MHNSDRLLIQQADEEAWTPQSELDLFLNCSVSEHINYQENTRINVAEDNDPIGSLTESVNSKHLIRTIASEKPLRKNATLFGKDSAYFADTTDYLSGPNTGWPLTTGSTVGLNFKLANMGAVRGLFNYGASSNNFFSAAVGIDGRLQIGSKWAAVGSVNNIGSSAVVIHTDHTLILTIEADRKTVKAYIDGVFLGQKTYAAAIPDNQASFNFFLARASHTGRQLIGYENDLFIIPRVLTNIEAIHQYLSRT